MSTRCVVDLDSGSVGVCSLALEDTPHISGVLRLPFTAQPGDPGALEVALLAALRTALDSLKDVPADAPVDVVVASPWFDASLIALEGRQSGTISELERRRLIEEARAQYPTAPHLASLEELSVETRVNGHVTTLTNPVHGGQLSVLLYRSVADASFITRVQDVIHAARPHAPVFWHTTPTVYAGALRAVRSDAYTIIDVGSEVTDLVLMSQGVIRALRSVPAGYRTIARTIAPDRPLADTLSRLSMLARAELRAPEADALQSQLSRAAHAFADPLITALKDAGNSAPFTHQVLLIGDSDALVWLPQVVDLVQFGGRPLQSTLVDHELLRGLATFGASGVFDASLVTASLFFHTTKHKSRKKSWIERVLYSTL
ncbi:hypothetical protein KGO06_00400 [Patescibacteria group bacterium]|nr:hypothetical protein [Patescibacteria group bacterium]